MPERAPRPGLRRAAVGLVALTLAACSPPAEDGTTVIATPPEVQRATGPELPPDLVAARKRMVERQPVPFADIRRLADLDDGYAAWLLAENLRSQDRWDLGSDMAHYYAVAAASGRAGGLSRLIELMSHPEVDVSAIDPARLAWLEKALIGAARRGDVAAATYLIDAYTDGRPFGRKPEAAMVLLTEPGSTGRAELALEMATGRIRSEGLGAHNIQEVRALLEVASASDSLQAQITTANLMALLDSRAPGPAGGLAARTEPSIQTGDSDHDPD